MDTHASSCVHVLTRVPKRCCWDMSEEWSCSPVITVLVPRVSH